MAGMLKSDKETGLPEIHPGDVVRVHQKIKEGSKERIQVFEGIIIKTHGKTGHNATFTVRKIAYGVGVEKTFPLQSPTIVKIEFKKSSEVRRAKLFYLRQLSGKALKMKDKKLDREIWELVAKIDEESEELSEEVLEEAIKAEEAQKQAATDVPADEATGERAAESEGGSKPVETNSSDQQQPTETTIETKPESAKNDTVGAEVDNGNTGAKATEAES